VYTGSCGTDGLIAKGRFASTSGFNLTVQDAAEIAGVALNDSVEITAGAGVTPDFYEVVGKAGATLTLHVGPGNSTGDVAWQVNDNQFFNQLLYLKGYEEAAPPGCCGNPNDTLSSEGMVDMNDFAIFANCFGGTGPGPSCSAGDFECCNMDDTGSSTGLVDMNDFGTFAVLFGQAATSTPPNCLN